MGELQREKYHSGFMGSMLTGLGPRSNDTAVVDRYVRDGHSEQSAFQAAVENDAKKLVSAQRDSFLFKSGGQLDWRDILRPIAASFEGFSKRESQGEDAIGPVTRFLRTDTFYRRPAIEGKIDCVGTEISLHLPNLGTSSVVFLPAPYTLTRMVDDSYYHDSEGLALDYARAIAKSEPSLKAKGYDCVILVEPFVGYEQSKGAFENPIWLEKSISIIKLQGITLGVTFPLAEAQDVVPLIEKSRADFVGIDAVSSSGFGINTGKNVLLGVVNGAHAGRSIDGKIVVESQEKITGLVREFLSEAQFPGKYYIGPNDRLYDVPFEHALAKIEALARFGGTD